MAELIGSLGTFRRIKHVIHVIANWGKLFKGPFHIFCSNIFIIWWRFLVLIRCLRLEKVAKYVIDSKYLRIGRGSHLLSILGWLRRFLLLINVLLLFRHLHDWLLLFHLFRRGDALDFTRTPSSRFGCLRHCLLLWGHVSNFLAWFRLHLRRPYILWFFLYQWSLLSFNDHGLLPLAICFLNVNAQLRLGLLLNWRLVSGPSLLLAF